VTHRVLPGCHRRRPTQAGFALITGLLLLLVITIIAVAMFHGFGTEEQIAGNTREKQRALNAAISAEQWAEWWLSSGNAPQPTACAAGIVPSASGVVCTQPLADFTNPPWNTGVQFTQFGQTLANTNKTGPQAQYSYYSSPVFYVTYIGQNTDLGGNVYQIDAYGYGTNADTVAVVQSTYVISTGDTNGGGE
jgi:type IV pilus assembly protein PilX